MEEEPALIPATGPETTAPARHACALRSREDDGARPTRRPGQRRPPLGTAWSKGVEERGAGGSKIPREGRESRDRLHRNEGARPRAPPRVRRRSAPVPTTPSRRSRAMSVGVTATKASRSAGRKTERRCRARPPARRSRHSPPPSTPGTQQQRPKATATQPRKRSRPRSLQSSLGIDVQTAAS